MLVLNTLIPLTKVYVKSVAVSILLAIWSTILLFYLITLLYYTPLLFDPNLAQYHWRQNPDGIVIRGPYYMLNRVSFTPFLWICYISVIVVMLYLCSRCRTREIFGDKKYTALKVARVTLYMWMLYLGSLFLAFALLYWPAYYHTYRVTLRMSLAYLPLLISLPAMYYGSKYLKIGVLPHILAILLIYVASRSLAFGHHALFETVTSTSSTLILVALLSLLLPTYAYFSMLPPDTQRAFLVRCSKVDKRFVELAVLLICFSLLAYLGTVSGKYQDVLNFDDNRLALTSAFVSERVLWIDNQLAVIGSMDISYREGHYYCDKAPGVSFILVPGYLLGLLLSGITNAHPYWWCLSEYYVINATLPIAMWRITRKLGRDSLSGLLAAICATFATPFLAFSLYVGWSYSITAVLGAWSVERLMPWGKFMRRDLILSAQLCGLAVMCEYAFGVFAVLLCLAVIYSSGECKPLYIISLIPLSAILATYHTLCFGAPWLTGYHFHIDKASTIEYWWGGNHWLAMITGFDENIFIFCPFLVASCVGGVMWWRDEQFHCQRPLLLVFSGTLIGTYIFYSNWPYRIGESLGSWHWPSLFPRFMIAPLVLMPLLSCPVFESIREKGHSKSLVAISLMVVVLGAYYALLCVAR